MNSYIVKIRQQKQTQKIDKIVAIQKNYSTVYMYVCMRDMHRCIHRRIPDSTYSYPMLFKSRNRIQIKTKCKMLVLSIEQNFT